MGNKNNIRCQIVNYLKKKNKEFIINFKTATILI